MSNNLARGQEKLSVPLSSYTKDESCDDLQYQTGQNVGGQKRAADVIAYGTYPVSTLNAIAAGSTQRILKKTAHGARKNDIVHFTSGNCAGLSIQIQSCPDANTMILVATPEFTLAVADTFDILRYIPPRYASDGSITVSESVKTPSFQESAVITSGAVVTFTAPANAKWCKIETDDGNPDKLRVRVDGVDPSATSGHQFQPGRSEDFPVVGNIKLIAETGGGNNYACVTFGV